MLNLSITKNNSCAVIPQAFPTRQDGEVKSLVCPWHYRGETIQRPQPHPLLLESYQSMGAPDLSWFGEKKKRKA
jgi:hypothetical protein